MWARRTVWLFGLIMMCVNVYRAKTQSLVCDEAFTFLHFVSRPLGEAVRYPDANNHVLNTLLVKLTCYWFGVSELTVRLPALIGGAVFLFGALHILNHMVTSTATRVVFAMLLLLHPGLDDLLSAARGYALALGILMLCIVIAVRGSTDAGAKRRWLFLCGALGALACCANLTFLVPTCAVLCLTACRPDRAGPAAIVRRVAFQVIGFLPVFLCIQGPFLINTTRDQFYAGEPTWRGAIISLESITLYGRVLAVTIGQVNVNALVYRALSACHITDVVVPLLIVGVFVSSLITSMMLYRPLMALGERETDVLVAYYCGGVVALSVVVLSAAHHLIHIPFPTDRTGIYFIPLLWLWAAATLSAATAFVGRAIWLGAPLLLLVGVQEALQFRTDHYQIWRYDATTKEFVRSIPLAPIAGSPTVCTSWVMADATNFYRILFSKNWSPVDRRGLREGCRYYLVTKEERGECRRLGLVIRRESAVSESALAVPQE